jgi:hypothetical protein
MAVEAIAKSEISNKKRMKLGIIILCAVLTGCGSSVSMPVGQTVTRASINPPQPSLPPWLLHLPGIGGKRSIDLAMTRGFEEGGFTGDIEIYDWTENDPGINALIADARNHKEARLIAEKITARFDKDPASPIYFSSHSGGGGVAVWALEDLPPQVKVNTVLMMAPALSPQYDLTKALQHVTGKVYVFSSTQDFLVLETGCKLMGTIDGVKTPAAGYCGFVRPETGDVGQYAKLVSMPYNPQWIMYDDYGNHVGAMTRSFARSVLAPLVLSGRLPALASTLPTATDAASSSQKPSQALQ